MPRLTPAQRQFGLGLTPIEKAFRPPQGMEDDPAYNDYARQRWADADFQDAQRAQARAILMEQEDKQAQRASEQQMADVEQRATEAMRGKSPDEIPNIIAQFPELARSKNLGGFTHFAQTVNPSAGQKTLAPSLRNKLKPHERQYFDEHFSQGGDAIGAFDAAQLRGEHENGLVDMMKSGVPLDVIDKYRDRPMSPLEREAIVQQHAVTKGGSKDDHRADAMRESIRSMYEALPDTDAEGKPLGFDEILRQRAEIADKAYRTFYPEKFQQPPAVATPAAEGRIPAASGAPQAVQQPATPAIQNLDLSKIPYAEREKYVADVEKQAKEAEEINKKWYKAQTDLQSKLEKEIGLGNIGNTNYSKLRSFAEAVVNGDTTPTGELGTGGEYRMDVPVGYEVLKKIGIKPSQSAFVEPGNRRTGTQEVTYDDLLKTWAENYLKTAPKTIVPQVPALPIKKAQAVDSVLDSLLKPSNS